MESIYQSFAESFQECCIAACTRLAYEKEQTDTDYATRTQKCDQLYNRIKEKLGEEYMLINRFDAAKNFERAFDDVYIYQQGFQDCVTLLRWIGLL